METRKLLVAGVLLAVFVFFSSLILGWQLSSTTVAAPNETRRDALIATLASRQSIGGWFNGSFDTDTHHQLGATTSAVSTLAALNSPERIDVEKAVAHLVSLQNKTNGGFPLYSPVGFVYELSVPFRIVNSLKSVNCSFMLDPIILDLVTSRCNSTDGGFSEPTFEYDGEEVSWCNFDMVFHGMADTHSAYSRSNVISTFLAVDILRSMNALDRINVTKTVQFVLSCKASNGGFGPYPSPHGEPYAPYLTENPFTVDSYGAGVAYTYAAVGTLNDLNYTVSLSSEERELTRKYVLSCQHPRSGCFVSIPDYADVPWLNPEDHDIFFTYYAVMALQYIGAVDASRENLTQTNNWLMNKQLLKDRFTYGLFDDLSPEAAAFDAVMCLNASDSLYLLDQLTPRAVQQQTLLLTISTASAITTFVLVVAIPRVVKRTRTKKSSEEMQPA